MISILLLGSWNILLLIICIGVTILSIIFILLKKLDKPFNLIYFLGGIWLLFFTIGSPILAISYLSFSFHMIQMSFLFFIIPPLILLGIPQRCYDQISPFIKKTYRFRFQLSPQMALTMFALFFFLYHLPFILTIISANPLIQKGYLTILFLLTFRMWWPIVAPNIAVSDSNEKRKKFIRDSSLYIMPACLMFIIAGFLDGMSNPFFGQIATHLCLPADGTVEILPSPFNTKYDQISAGVFMLGIHKMVLMFTNRIGFKMNGTGQKVYQQKKDEK
ncbi:cytochrome c oxidase assembly protein [Pseudogracilibacillus auburnensis]|uniref:cytochrome c oxidase assembly protein n=1 Tax=Pseudogracilibacillus auburnensis TaxID=1494959 RepID=UPI001A9706FA|nr:cytochrome c oxidase assembly protein [Pseudogracilibacillus auburnensis]MBO1002998.1 cytochrome c oxidase assembly protein [Pseudogracilibacillus auburnensis]